MQNTNNRQHWADYTKAFAIWLMVLCHFGLRPQRLVEFIYIFHMPVFFLISGYFDKGTSFSWEFLKRNFKRLAIPYFFFSICSFSICWISPYIHPEIYNNGNITQTFCKAFIGMFLMEDQVRSYAFMPMGSLWFLVALFNIRIIFSFICLWWHKCRYAILLIIIIGLGIVYYSFPFFSLDSTFIALPFYISGYMLKQRRYLEFVTNNWIILLLAFVCWLYTAIIGFQNGRIDIDACVTGNNMLFFYINGIIGSTACIFTFKLFKRRNPYLQEVGSSTLTILGTHQYINKFMTFLAVVFMGVAPSKIPIWYIVLFSVLALIIGVNTHRVLSRFCPKMIGIIK